MFIVAELTTIYDTHRMCHRANALYGFPCNVCTVAANSSLMGTLLVLAFGRIVSQLVGSSHPIYQFSLLGVEQLVSLSLGVKKTGIIHVSWVAAAATRKAFYLNPEEYAFSVIKGKLDDSETAMTTRRFGLYQCAHYSFGVVVLFTSFIGCTSFMVARESFCSNS